MGISHAFMKPANVRVSRGVLAESVGHGRSTQDSTLRACTQPLGLNMTFLPLAAISLSEPRTHDQDRAEREERRAKGGATMPAPSPSPNIRDIDGSQNEEQAAAGCVGAAQSRKAVE
uniref:Uncharacterized protein n=1 Tax=Oryza rufipogon TaxID=4529 RepID=A0A0E0MWZ9_ORYRU